MLGVKGQHFIDNYYSLKEHWLICWNDPEIRGYYKRKSWVKRLRWNRDNGW